MNLKSAFPRWQTKYGGTQMKTTATAEYLESELGVSAFLLAKGVRLLGLIEIAPSRYSFRFAEDSAGSTAQTALDYLAGASVVAKDLISAERSLKTLLYSRPNNGLGTRNFNPNRKANGNYVSTEHRIG